MTTRPTLDEVRSWPATVSVADACTALGISRSHGYSLIKIGAFPARIVAVGSRRVVVTASLVALLGGDAAA